MSGAAVPATAQSAPTIPVGLSWQVVRKNLTVVAASYAIGSIAGFATQSVFARVLGTETYGIYAAGVALVTIAGVAQEIAGPAWLVRTAAQRDVSFGELSGSVVGFRALASVAVIAVVAVAATAMGYGARGVVVVVMLAAVAGVNAIFKTLRAGFQAAERMSISASLATANAVTTAAVMIAIVAAGAGLAAALVGSLAISLVLLVPTWRLLPRVFRPRLNLGVAAMRAAARDSLPFTVVAGLSFALSYADTLVVRAMLGTHATGLYGGAWRLVSILQWVPAILLDSVLRGFSSLAARDRKRFGNAVDRASAGLLFVALPVALAGSMLAEPVFVFVFGAQFAPGAEAFRILLWSLPLAYPSWVLIEAVLVSGQPARVGWLLGGASAVNIAGNIVVVPRWGIEGSAWMMFATQVIVLVGAAALLHAEGVRMRWPVALLPAAIVAAATVAATAPVRHAPLVVPLSTGSAAFVFVTLGLWWCGRGWRPAQRWFAPERDWLAPERET
jgi:O-antigen/teichoic acid export membrane protein